MGVVLVRRPNSSQEWRWVGELFTAFRGSAGFNIMVDFIINLIFLNRRRELRFPTIKAFCRDSEIAPTKEVSIYFYNSL